MGRRVIRTRGMVVRRKDLEKDWRYIFRFKRIITLFSSFF
jgi:hypothetical protein